MLDSQIPAADTVFHLVAVTIVLSVLAHSSTDGLVARWFDEPDEPPPAPDRPNGMNRTGPAGRTDRVRTCGHGT